MEHAEEITAKQKNNIILRTWKYYRSSLCEAVELEFRRLTAVDSTLVSLKYKSEICLRNWRVVNLTCSMY